VRKETFFYSETGELLKRLDEAARRSSVSRGQAFEDFLHMGVCALSGGRMEEPYLAVVKKHSDGPVGKRGCDTLGQMFGAMVHAMEETRENMRDILGDLFQGAITYGEAGQYMTPEPITRLMAKLTAGDAAEDPSHVRSVCDPCCGSGRMLLSMAELNRHWEFIGQDVDLRCVRMTAINLALRNLYGYVIHGNSLMLEQKLVYRTGFDGRGVIAEVPLAACPESVRQVVANPAPSLPVGTLIPRTQLKLF
jgi:hypothetical protein